MAQAYDPKTIEPRWQDFWRERKTFKAYNPGEPGFDPERPKFYVLDMFPYPSGAGLHVGHPIGYIGSDIVARRKRQEGYNVLHPMGWDAFACRPSSTPSRPASIRPRRPARTSPTSSASCR